KAASRVTWDSLRSDLIPAGHAAMSAGVALTPGHRAAAVHTLARNASTGSPIARGPVSLHPARTPATTSRVTLPFVGTSPRGPIGNTRAAMADIRRPRT